MASPVYARLTASEGRRFGFTLGAAFLVVGALLLWRGREYGAAIAAALAAGLLVAALACPSSLGGVQRAWMSVAKAISKVTTPLIMGAVYILVISVIGMIMRAFGHNAIARRADATSHWLPFPPRDDSKKSMEHQY